MRAPLGKNEIGKLMKTAAQSAGLQGNFTNHTVRKTCISRLMDAEVPLNYVAQLSGHKNLRSLDSYKAASADHQRKMSLILSRSGQESIQTSTVSVYENTTLPANLPKDVSKLGVFSGACLHRENWRLHLHVQNCSWKRRKPKVHEAQEKKNHHQRWFRFWLVNWT